MHDLVATAAGQLLFLIYSADTWCGAGVGTGIDPGAIETVGCNGCSTNINGCSTNISNSSELWRQQAFILSAVGKCQPPKYELRWVTTALCLNLTCPISATSDSSFCLLSEQPLAACASMRDFEKLLRVSPSNELQRVSDGWALDWGRWRAGGPEQLGFEAAAPVVAWKQWYNDSCPSIWTTQDSGGRCCLTVETTPPAAPPPPPRPGHTTNIVTSEYNYTSKYALLDPAIVGHSANGAFLTMGPVKKLGRPLISEGQTPWEQPAVTKITSPTPGFRTLGYGNVYPSVYWNESSRRYTLYINPFISNAPCSSPPGKQHAGPGVMASGVLRFTSADGLAWQRSDEGQVPWNGSTANNIVAYPTGGVGILSDPAALSMQAAVKMWGVYYIDETAAKPVSTTRAGGRWSSDGVRWLAAQAMNDYSQFGASMDTHNNAFYDKRTQRWIGITRTHERVGPGNVNVRCAARTEAMNFSGPWSTAETVLCGNCTTADPRSPYSCQVYAMIVAPYYQVRAMYVHSPSERGIGFSRPHWHCRKSDAYDGGGRTPSCETVQGYIGFTMMFNGGYGATMGQQWNDSQGLVETVELELSWSNDTRTWTRILPGTPLIPRSRTCFSTVWICQSCRRHKQIFR